MDLGSSNGTIVELKNHSKRKLTANLDYGEDITGNKYDHNERYMTEDMIVVTKNGCELLSDYNNTENLFIIE